MSRDFLDRAGLTFKKTLRASEQDRHEIARRREMRPLSGVRSEAPGHSVLHPIEQPFSKLKTRLSKEIVHTREQTGTCIGALLDQLTTQECAAYFREAGYST